MLKKHFPSKLKSFVVPVKPLPRALVARLKKSQLKIDSMLGKMKNVDTGRNKTNWPRDNTTT